MQEILKERREKWFSFPTVLNFSKITAAALKQHNYAGVMFNDPLIQLRVSLHLISKLGICQTTPFSECEVKIERLQRELALKEKSQTEYTKSTKDHLEVLLQGIRGSVDVLDALIVTRRNLLDVMERQSRLGISNDVLVAHLDSNLCNLRALLGKKERVDEIEKLFTKEHADQATKIHIHSLEEELNHLQELMKRPYKLFCQWLEDPILKNQRMNPVTIILQRSGAGAVFDFYAEPLKKYHSDRFFVITTDENKGVCS